MRQYDQALFSPNGGIVHLLPPNYHVCADCNQYGVGVPPVNVPDRRRYVWGRSPAYSDGREHWPERSMEGFQRIDQQTAFLDWLVGQTESQIVRLQLNI